MNPSKVRGQKKTESDAMAHAYNPKDSKLEASLGYTVRLGKKTKN